MTRRLYLVTPGMAGAPPDYLVSLTMRVSASSSHEAADLVERVFMESEFASNAPRMWFVDITVDQLVEIDGEDPNRVTRELADDVAKLFEADDLAKLFEAAMVELEASYPSAACADCDDHPEAP